MPGQVTLEICVDSLDLAVAAARGGADRIELCGPLQGGGTTPSAGFVAAARSTLHLPLAMLIRPRTGAFTASAAEFEVMRHDLLFARATGIDIAVLGILHADRTVDVARTRELIAIAQPMQVTFHRAFDVTADPFTAIEAVINTGATRILTSGASSTAVQGASMVARLRDAAADRLGLLLCGSISSATVAQALAVSGASEVHAALRSSIGPHPLSAPLSEEGKEHFTEAVAQLKCSLRLAAGSVLAGKQRDA